MAPFVSSQSTTRERGREEEKGLHSVPMVEMTSKGNDPCRSSSQRIRSETVHMCADKGLSAGGDDPVVVRT